MGEVIRRTASPVDIIADVRATLTNAAAKGGVWKTLADERLSPLMAVVTDVDARYAKAESDLTPLQAAVDAKDVDADRMLGRVSDEIWNEVGRPASDPALSILFPGGIAYYADGDVEGQPDRMDLLAELLEASLHPRLPPAQAKAHAKEVRAAAKTLRAAVDLAQPARARVELLDRVRRALATGAQVELSSLKRLYKVERFSEADIHAVIPDRPMTARKSAATPPPVDGPALPPGGSIPVARAGERLTAADSGTLRVGARFREHPTWKSRIEASTVTATRT